MSGDLIIGGAVIVVEGAQIHRMHEAGRALHCRSSGTVSSPARRIVSSTVVPSPKLTPNLVRLRRSHTADIKEQVYLGAGSVLISGEPRNRKYPVIDQEDIKRKGTFIDTINIFGCSLKHSKFILF